MSNSRTTSSNSDNSCNNNKENLNQNMNVNDKFNHLSRNAGFKTSTQSHDLGLDLFSRVHEKGCPILVQDKTILQNARS